MEVDGGNISITHSVSDIGNISSVGKISVN